jgi:DNA-binding NtrC family response regulator
MNFSDAILICDENEAVRNFIRDLLTKNGFFHIIEASSVSEIEFFLNKRKDFIVLIDSKFATNDLMMKLRHQKDYILFADKNHPNISTLAARIGITHIMTAPLHSRKLMKRFTDIRCKEGY